MSKSYLGQNYNKFLIMEDVIQPKPTTLHPTNFRRIYLNTCLIAFLKTNQTSKIVPRINKLAHMFYETGTIITETGLIHN